MTDESTGARQRRPLSARASGRSLFTLIELLVVVAIIAVLASLLLPTLSQARIMAKKSSSMNNFAQIAKGYTMAADDLDGWFPRRRMVHSSYGEMGALENGGYSWALMAQKNAVKSTFSDTGRNILQPVDAAAQYGFDASTKHIMLDTSKTWSELYAPAATGNPARYSDIAIVAGLGQDQGLASTHEFNRTPPLQIAKGTPDDTIVQDAVHAFWVPSWGGYTQYRTVYARHGTPPRDSSGNNIFYDTEEKIGDYTSGLHAARYDGSVRWVQTKELEWIRYRWFPSPGYWGIYAVPGPDTNW